MSIEDTLAERQQTHGDFSVQSMISQMIKLEMREATCSNWDNLDWDMQESLDMIVHKIARILAGNPEHIDSWHDISGYATLIEKRLKRDLEKDLNGNSSC
jgi:hypothetical protein